MLRTDWFVKDSIGATLRNIIDAGNREYFEQVSEGEFEQGLLREIRFLGAFNQEQELTVVKYIHEHLDELYRYATQPDENKAPQRSERAY